QEAGAVFLMKAVENSDVSLFAGALGGDLDGAARLLIAAGDVEGVDVVTDGAVQHSFGHQIHGIGGGIDDGSSNDAFLVETVSETAGQSLVADSGRSDRAGSATDVLEHAGVPELGAGVGVNGVDRIRHGDDVDDVVGTLPENIHVGHVEGLGHHVGVGRRSYARVYGKAEEVAEAILVDVGGGEQSFVDIRAVACAIKAAGGKRLLRERGRQQDNTKDEQSQAKIAGRRRTYRLTNGRLMNGPGSRAGTDFRNLG